MTTLTPTTVAPGWYRDPAGTGFERYFDGHAWTSQARPVTMRRRTTVESAAAVVAAAPPAGQPQPVQLFPTAPSLAVSGPATAASAPPASATPTPTPATVSPAATRLAPRRPRPGSSTTTTGPGHASSSSGPADIGPAAAGIGTADVSSLSAQFLLLGTASELPPRMLRTTGVSPAGWYPDPARSGGVRFFDGTRWTPRMRSLPEDQPRRLPRAALRLRARLLDAQDAASMRHPKRRRSRRLVIPKATYAPSLHQRSRGAAPAAMAATVVMVIGLCAVLFFAWELWGTNVYTQYHQRQLVQELSTSSAPLLTVTTNSAPGTGTPGGTTSVTVPSGTGVDATMPVDQTGATPGTGPAATKTGTGNTGTGNTGSGNTGSGNTGTGNTGTGNTGTGNTGTGNTGTGNTGTGNTGTGNTGTGNTETGNTGTGNTGTGNTGSNHTGGGSGPTNTGGGNSSSGSGPGPVSNPAPTAHATKNQTASGPVTTTTTGGSSTGPYSSSVPIPRITVASSVPDSTPIGRIVIPRIGLSMAFVLGTDAPQLALGPGLWKYGVLPGTPGNATIAGHRTTYLHPFYLLNEVRDGDLIDIYVPGQPEAIYQVRGTTIANPFDVAITRDTGGVRLTLSTCNPVGSTSQRLVVEAEEIAGKYAQYATPASKWKLNR